jgi:hypothetical protein
LDICKYDATIQVKFVKNLGDAYGYCFGDRENLEIEIALYLDGVPIDRETKLKTIAHEFVHARQYLKGHLDEEASPLCLKWKGKLHRVEDPGDDSYEPPWEAEPKELEDILYNECYLKYLKKNN